MLWFHTIVRPFFGLDGSNSRSGADAAQRLIDGAKPEFEEASLFLFFQGRVNRLKVYRSKWNHIDPSRIFFIYIFLQCIKSFNFIFSAILVMLCIHTKGLYKFQYKEKYVCYAYMKLVGPMFYFYNGKMLQTHFCSLNVIQDGQKVFIATFHQVSLVNIIIPHGLRCSRIE